MEPQSTHSNASTNELLAHLNDKDESHASTRVDFAHPGTVVQPLPKSPELAPEPTPDPVVPIAKEPPKPPPLPPTPPPAAPMTPTAPKSPHNRRPIIIAIVVVLVLAMLGAAAYWWFKVRQPAASTTSTQTVQELVITPVTPTNLSQANSTGQAVTTGANLRSPLELHFTINTNANHGAATPEIEIQPLGTAFTNVPNYKGEAVQASGSAIIAKVPISDLKDGSYHWQARMNTGTEVGDWAAFGQGTAADFVVDNTAPKAPAVTAVGSQNVKSGTSLTTTANPTTVSGTADPGTAISVVIQPDNQTVSATADAKGKWTVTLQQALANGEHTLSIASADAAGNTANSSFTVSSNTAAAAPATQQVAATGDHTNLLTIIGLLLMAMSAAGLVVVARSGKAKI